MKKRFTIIHNQQGFLLFHVVWVILIVFLSIQFLLYHYHTSKAVAQNQLYHIEIETLFQMAYQQLRNETGDDEISFPYQTDYVFPQGDVTITLHKERNNTIYIVFLIKPTDSNHTYRLSRPYV
ncbi:hypothetical protein BN997_04071 [Oceanobacillus oncorhynchi]|uniref:ComG operon protein 7 n=1 Tax=Oceanobacillus oncorhynchi TaxID=545501 RepID=A0A0A1MZF5_9BACI|nr:hypothetical protein [Oceanobacillus oncorhynchi]CEI84136.1 hypothetical protein BN997_04071 [Oceanobacillus oncorhynchi]